MVGGTEGQLTDLKGFKVVSSPLFPANSIRTHFPLWNYRQLELWHLRLPRAFVEGSPFCVSLAE